MGLHPVKTITGIKTENQYLFNNEDIEVNHVVGKSLWQCCVINELEFHLFDPHKQYINAI